MPGAVVWAEVTKMNKMISLPKELMLVGKRLYCGDSSAIL